MVKGGHGQLPKQIEAINTIFLCIITSG